jgi:uncharacterized membrane protein YraQ (UPF0718 family)
VIGLDRNKKLPDALHFFFYDSTKIALLLVGITFAASLGIVTPFCSCSAVPVFIGFLSAGIPIGITLSFLIASPLINEIAVGLLFSMFSGKLAAIYLASGLTIAISSGLVLGKLKAKRWIEPFVFETKLNQQPGFAAPRYTLSARTKIGIKESISIVPKIWPYLLAGIALGAIIHGWAPASFFVKYKGAGNSFAVVVAVLFGIPLHSNAPGVIPIVQVLHDKGLPMETLLAFMMILLRRVLKPKLLATFISVVGLGITFVGYLFNAILH